MVSFRDFIKEDFNTFINPNEFSEEVKIDGHPVYVVIDEDEFTERQLKNNKEGLATSGLLFYVKTVDLPFFPRVDQSIRFNDDHYHVVSVQENEGLLSIELEVPTG
jgi:hypothetical protein